VVNVFLQDDAPVSKLKRTAIVMMVAFFGGALAALASLWCLWETGALAIGVIPLILPLLVVIALPFVPGVILCRAFRDDVIPACRGVCSEEEIVSGALKSLRYLWGRYLLELLPVILIVLGLAVLYCFTDLGRYSFRRLGLQIVLSYALILLGECALAVFPVARLFSRRAGMIAMLILIVLGQIVLLLHALFGASGLLFFTDGTPEVREYMISSIVLIAVGVAIFGGGLRYFIRSAYQDAEKEGLL